MRQKVESDFIHNNLRCIVLALDAGHRCGYVEVPKNHPLFGIEYSQETSFLNTLWESVKEGPIGKRGIIPIFCKSHKEGPQSPDVVFDVHGGLTYSGGGGEYPIKSDGWWFGFDCAHSGDAKDWQIMSEDHKEIENKFGFSRDGEVRSNSYVVEECRNLADQLQSIAQAALPEPDGKTGDSYLIPASPETDIEKARRDA